MRTARLLKSITIQIIIVALFLELGLRVLQKYHHPSRVLLHSSTAGANYEQVQSLEELLELSSIGFRPYTEIFGFILNSKSFRTREYTVSRAKDSYRILALGDSFTFASGGTPFIDHWTTRVELGLSRISPVPVEMINLGAPGVGPQFELRLWQLEGAQLEPDLVILGLFVGNDFTDDQGGVTVLSNEGLYGRLVDASLVVRAARNLYRLRKRSATNRNEGNATAGETAKGSDLKQHQHGGFELARYRSVYNPLKPTFPEEVFLDIETRRMALCLRKERKRFDRLFHSLSRTLLVMHDEITRSGSDFIVMIIPDEYQVNPEVAAAVLERTGYSLADYDLRLPQERLVAFFQDANIDYLDLLPAFLNRFETGTKDRPLYRLRDTHWSDAGNAIAAEQLVEQITGKSQQLLLRH